MFKVFETYIRSRSNFTAEELEIIKSLTISKRLKKKQALLSLGDVCRYHTFVCSGCLRSYRIGEDGTEHILDFGSVNHWVTDEMSMFASAPTIGYIDALEDTDIIQISGDNYKRLICEMPNFEALHQKVTIENMTRGCERIYSMISKNADDRYHDFKLAYPDLYHRLPLYMVASYLGVTRETLTRVRGNNHVASQ